MKTQLLSAAAAAVFALTACQDPGIARNDTVIPSKPTPVVVAPKATRPLPEPKVEPVKVAEAPKPEEPVDVLMLKHDEARIDHFARAKQMKEEGDPKGALTEARRALYSHPTDADTLAFIGNVATKTGQHALAAEAFGRLAMQRTDDATPLISQARSLVKAKAFTQATVVARQAIAKDAGNPEGYQAAGLGHLAVGELQDAITMFSKVVELKPDHGWALNNLGLAYLRANENEKAVDVLQKAAEQLPSTAYVHNNLGVALERVGRKDEAKQAYLTSTTLSPKYVKARINAERVAKATAPESVDNPATDPEFETEAPDTAPEN